jgi:NAD-dependent deacetylase
VRGTCPAARPVVRRKDEYHYHFYSSLKAARETALLLVVGTAGATNLPNQVASEVHQRGGVIVDVNIETNPFARLAESSGRGFSVQQPSASALPAILAAMAAG